MTVYTTQSKTVAVGNGAATVFPFYFRAPAAADVEVTLTRVDGASRILTLDVDFSVQMTRDGGSVSFPIGSGAILGVGETLTIRRVVPLIQGTALPNGGAFHPEAVERQFDKVVMGLQQVNEGIGRSLSAPVDEDGVDLVLPTRPLRKNKLMAFDADGRPVSTSISTLDLEAVVSGQVIGGRIMVEIPPIISDGTLDTVETNVDLSNAAYVDMVIGGIPQRGVYEVNGTRILLPGPVPIGVKVSVKIFGVSPEAPAPTAPSLTGRAHLLVDASAGPVVLFDVPTAGETIIRKMDASPNPVRVAIEAAIFTEAGDALLSSENGVPLAGDLPVLGGDIVLTQRYQHAVVIGLNNLLYRSS